MLKVVIVGYGEMFTNLIAGTLDANCEIVGVLRRETIKYSPLLRRLKDIFNPSLEYSYVKSYNLPEIEVDSVNSEKFKRELLKLIYDLPKIATINAHPSLLPQYRGPNPYFWTIRNCEQMSGITFHLMEKGFDTGAILAQEEVKIYPSDTGKSLKERTVLTARGVVCELLKALREDIIIPLTQREDKASYYSNPSDLELDFTKSAEENYALVCAIYPWSEAYFYHKNTCFAVSPFGAELVDNNSEYKDVGTICEIEDKKISVLCGDNKILKMPVVLYKKVDRIFTKNYIKREMRVGEILSQLS